MTPAHTTVVVPLAVYLFADLVDHFIRVVGFLLAAHVRLHRFATKYPHAPPPYHNPRQPTANNKAQFQTEISQQMAELMAVPVTVSQCRCSFSSANDRGFKRQRLKPVFIDSSEMMKSSLFCSLFYSQSSCANAGILLFSPALSLDSERQHMTTSAVRVPSHLREHRRLHHGRHHHALEACRLQRESSYC